MDLRLPLRRVVALTAFEGILFQSWVICSAQHAIIKELLCSSCAARYSDTEHVAIAADDRWNSSSHHHGWSPSFPKRLGCMVKRLYRGVMQLPCMPRQECWDSSKMLMQPQVQHSRVHWQWKQHCSKATEQERRLCCQAQCWCTRFLSEERCRAWH